MNQLPRTYAVTGSASGMGQSVLQRLRGQGHNVIGIDIRDADIAADLSTAAGRQAAAEHVLEASSGTFHGAVLAAGVGPTPGAERTILDVNYFGVVDLLLAWREALASTDRAKVVVFSSNSTTTVPIVPGRAIRSLLKGDAEKALRACKPYRRASPAMAYAASKIAVTRWVRRQAVSPEWAGTGIRLNALAPGAIMTPLLQRQLATPSEAENIRRFPVPIGGFGDPTHLAEWAVFMLSDFADFLCGSVVFVDGGSDAYFRADDWPRAVPGRDLLAYLLRNRRFLKHNANRQISSNVTR